MLILLKISLFYKAQSLKSLLFHKHNTGDTAMKTEKAERDFVCRVCGCNKYREVQKSNLVVGSDGHTWVCYRICEGCSVLFMDPKKFSKK